MKTLTLRNVLTIDPGDKTGLAYWGSSGIFNPETELIQLGGVYTKANRETQLEVMWHLFGQYIYNKKKIRLINKAYIEGVEVWVGSLVSLTAARKGTLMKLTYLIGGYCRILSQYDIPFKIINPKDWKGQLPKAAVKKRIFRINNTEYVTPHETDAVGIGFGIMGIL